MPSLHVLWPHERGGGGERKKKRVPSANPPEHERQGRAAAASRARTGDTKQVKMVLVIEIDANGRKKTAGPVSLN